MIYRLFGFLCPERIVFTLNATDALNMAINCAIQRRNPHNRR
jgi:hypothetical protein